MFNNNPGNMRRWGGLPVEKGFVKFPSIPDGFAAMAKQLGLYGSRGLNTIHKIVNTWAPAADHNNVSSYIQRVVSSSGYAENQVIDLTDPTQLARIIYGMVSVEQGKAPAAYANVILATVGLPPGTPLSGPLAAEAPEAGIASGVPFVLADGADSKGTA